MPEDVYFDEAEKFSVLFNHVAGHAALARQAADKLVELVAERQWR